MIIVAQYTILCHYRHRQLYRINSQTTIPLPDSNVPHAGDQVVDGVVVDRCFVGVRDVRLDWLVIAISKVLPGKAVVVCSLTLLFGGGLGINEFDFLSAIIHVWLVSS